MSFSITAAGTANEVRQQVEQAKDNYSGGDRSQIDAVCTLIESELDGWPEGTRPGYVCGLLVEASGHHDAYSRNLNLSIRPLWLLER